MDSKCTKSNEDMLRMKITIEVQMTLIEQLSSEINDMKEIERMCTARKMADLSNENEVIKGKLKTSEAELSSYKVQVLQFKELQNKVDELTAEKDSYVRLTRKMVDLTKGIKSVADRLVLQTSVALDRAGGQISAYEEPDRQCEEFANANCGVRLTDSSSEEAASVALSVKACVTAPEATTVLAPPGTTTGTMAKVSEEPGTSGWAVESELLEEARNRRDDAPEEVRPMMTEDETSSDVAFKRLLSSNNPCIRELKELDMDTIKERGVEFCIDFLDQVATEEGLQMSYTTYEPKSGRDADDYSYVQLSISPIDTITFGYGESVVEAQNDTAFNCLLFLKYNMM